MIELPRRTVVQLMPGAGNGAFCSITSCEVCAIMFYHDGGKLQYPVRVYSPNPVFARALQQAIGGVEGEIRVCLQYMFQAFGSRGPAKYRDLLLNTATEEIGHIEMLATAVALNLEGAPLSIKEDVAKESLGGAVLNGMDF